MAKKVEQTPEITNDASKALLASQLEDSKGTHFNDSKTQSVVISSGSLRMDSYIKIHSGTAIRMGGPAEVGKTSEAMLIADNFMKTLKNSKAIYVNAESKLSEDLQKRTGLKFTRDPNEWDYGTVFVLDSNCFDTICDILVGQYKQIHEAGGHLCTIIDSVDMLRLKSSFDSKISDGKKPAGVNYITKEMFRHLAHPITHYNGLLIMITQYASTFTMSQYEAEEPSLMDGNKTHALNHMVSCALYYRPRTAKSYILEDETQKPDPVKNKILGVYAKVDIRKSSTDETGYMLEIPIKKGKVGNCIWVEKELFDVLFLLKLVTKSGSWITISDSVEKWAKEANLEIKLKHQGLEQFSNYFEANPKIMNWLVEKIKTWYS